MHGRERVAIAVVALLGAVVAGSSCAGSDRGPWARDPRAGPGETQLEPSEDVRRELSCDTAESLPVVRIESDRLDPQALPPGETMTHRMVYAFCPRRGRAALGAHLRRRFLREGRTIHTAVDDGFAFKPGRWSLEREIQVPDGTSPGPYTLDVEIDADVFRYRKTLHFTIQPSP